MINEKMTKKQMIEKYEDLDSRFKTSLKGVKEKDDIIQALKDRVAEVEFTNAKNSQNISKDIVAIKTEAEGRIKAVVSEMKNAQNGLVSFIQITDGLMIQKENDLKLQKDLISFLKSQYVEEVDE